MRRFSFYILLATATLFVHSCKDRKNKDAGTEILAEYNGKYLYLSDLPENIRAVYGGADSSGMLRAYVRKWLETVVVVTEAEKTLSEDQKNKEKLIEDYRNSLLIYEYQQHLIREKLDTGVTDAEIDSFYAQNPSAFQLKKNIVKIRYVKIVKQKPDLNRLKKLMQNPDPAGDAELKAFAEKNAENFYLDSHWLYLDDITKEIPLNENYNQQRFLANNKFISIDENNMLYLLYIIDFRIKDALSPLEFEKEKIRDIILYRRKLKFLKEHQQKLYEEALRKGDIHYSSEQP